MQVGIRIKVRNRASITRYKAHRKNTEALIKVRGGVLYLPSSQHQMEADYLYLLANRRHLLVDTGVTPFSSKNQCPQQMIQVLTTSNK